LTSTARTTLILVGLGILVLIAAAWGWTAAMQPLPAKVDSAVCVTTSIAAGEQVYPQQVTVSVYNAGRREGLAGRTIQLLQDRGFTPGDSGNEPDAKVATAAIWTSRPESPDVLLVASYFGKGVKIERRNGRGVGVTVVVGDGFRDLAEGLKSVRAARDARICSPPVN
jgi:hypothetical protein